MKYTVGEVHPLSILQHYKEMYDLKSEAYGIEEIGKRLVVLEDDKYIYSFLMVDSMKVSYYEVDLKAFECVFVGEK